MDDDDIALPSDTLQILNEFLREKALREREELENIQNKAGRVAKFEEDWQLSQFWYSDETKETLGRVVKKLLGEIPADDGEPPHIALLSCPSLYATIKEIHGKVKIFEYDKRFSAYGDDFVFYDFNEAYKVDYLQEHAQQYDIIIADPPFLSEECMQKISKIISSIRRSKDAKIIFCSGEAVEPWLTKCLNITKCNYRPEHERNLGNEFVSYANFPLDDFVS